MRPRVFPAEDVVMDGEEADDMARFNEAAGIPRGRLADRAARRPGLGRASMRPRVFPAEDGLVAHEIPLLIALQ